MKFRDKWEEISHQMDTEVEKAILDSGQKKVYVYYSAFPYEDEDEDIPINNLHEIAIKGHAILIRKADDFFGGPKSRDYKSPVLENPTWLDICVHANRMIKRVRDLHHTFLEGIEKSKKENKNGVAYYRFVMGS